MLVQCRHRVGRERVSISHAAVLSEPILDCRVVGVLSRCHDQGEIPESDSPIPSAVIPPEFPARCLARYTGIGGESHDEVLTRNIPNGVLAGSHGGCTSTPLTSLQANNTVICCEGVEIGYCLSSRERLPAGFSISGRSTSSVGT